MTGFPHEVLLHITCAEDGQAALHDAPVWCDEQGWYRYENGVGRRWIFAREIPPEWVAYDYYVENRNDGNTAAYCFSSARKALLFKLAWVGAHG